MGGDGASSRGMEACKWVVVLGMSGYELEAREGFWEGDDHVQ